MTDYLPEDERRTVVTPASPTTTLTWDFELSEESALRIFRKRSDLITELVKDTDFTLPSGIGDDQGGTATLAVASEAGDIYALESDLSVSRPSGYGNNGSFSSAQLNADANRIYRIAMELKTAVARALRLERTGASSWDLMGLPLINVPQTTIDTFKGDKGDKGDVGDTGSAGNNGSDGVNAGLRWTFDDASQDTAADPGTGNFRFDNVAVASVTEIAISNATGETGNPSAEAWLNSWDDSSSASKGKILIKDVADPENFAIFKVSAIAGETGYFRTTVSHVQSNGTLSGIVSVEFSETGDAGTGAVSSVNGQSGAVTLNPDNLDDSGTTHKFTSSGEINKLSGIATGATANSPDATLLARANHTGSQAQSTITSLVSDLAAKLALAGGTLTGFLTLHAAPTSDLHAATKKYVDDNSSAGLPDRIYVRHETATSVDGGLSSAGENSRLLDSEVANTIVGASLLSNAVTLPTGTYRCYASAPAYQSNRHRIFLYNNTDAAVELLGTSGFSAPSSAVQSRSFIFGEEFTIASSKEFVLKHYCQTATASTGLGLATRDGRTEIYAELIFEKVA